eukprot:1161402-Pelagomonas_calceolata.AAC.6
MPSIEPNTSKKQSFAACPAPGLDGVAAAAGTTVWDGAVVLSHYLTETNVLQDHMASVVAAEARAAEQAQLAATPLEEGSAAERSAGDLAAADPSPALQIEVSGKAAPLAPGSLGLSWSSYESPQSWPLSGLFLQASWVVQHTPCPLQPTILLSLTQRHVLAGPSFLRLRVYEMEHWAQRR